MPSSVDFSRITFWWLIALSVLMSGCDAARPISTPASHGSETIEFPANANQTAHPSPGSTATLIGTPTGTQKPSATATTTSTPTPTRAACLNAGGQKKLESLRSPRLKLPMEVRVYLPPCYHEQPEGRYPVLYLIHGMNYTEEQWDTLGADETADQLIGAQEIPPMIIVMPRDRLWNDPPETNFDEVFLEELIPWVDNNYRTINDRTGRAVGGLSRGGAWALHFGLGSWELFGAVGLHSAPIFWTDTRNLRVWLEVIPRESLPRIYIDIGDKDYLKRSNEWVIGILDQFNIPHEYYQFAGRHEEAYWAKHVEEYLRWYGAGW